MRLRSILLAVPVLLVATTTYGGPAAPGKSPEAKAPPAETEAPSAEDVASDRGPETKGVPALRAKLESNMGELGDLASQARADADLVRAACILDKQERGQGVMEVATGEILVIQDGATTGQARKFAVEKLAAASDRLDGLVEQARRCTGDQGPEADDDRTRTETDEPVYIPLADPTLGAGDPPIPPPVDDSRPPTVASPTN